MGRLLVRLVLAGLFLIFGLFNYFGSTSENPITGETQRVQLTPQQEVVLGQQARGEMVAQFGGLYQDEALQAYINRVGQEVVANSVASETPYQFEFYLLNDPQTVNAFALPGGPIFITTALLSRLNNEAQLAGVLGHEVGHVVARHSSEQLARRQLGALLVQAIGVAASDSYEQGRQAAVIAQVVNQIVNLNYGREDELESDRLGFRFMTEAGYNPQGIVELMEILNSAQQSGGQPEFLSTHPNPANRVERLEGLVAETFPNGVPPALEEGETQFAQVVQPRLP
jgi:predicted Zn-dependent protease